MATADKEDADEDKETAAGQPIDPMLVSGVLYRVNDVPPWHMCLLLGLQHYLTMFGGTFGIPFVVAKSACMMSDLGRVNDVISSTFVVMGIATFLQSTFGTRLPIIQGSTASIFVPTIAIAASFGPCPLINAPSSPLNLTDGSNSNLTTSQLVPWEVRVRMISGTIAVSSMFQVFLGCVGVTRILRFISPVSIAPTITLIGVALIDVARDMCAGHWWISMTSCVLVIVFSNYANRLNVCFPAYNRTRGVYVTRAPIFGMFPVMLSIVIMWFVCFLLTVTNVLPAGRDEWGYVARTDVRQRVISESAWVRVPYPMQFGMPTVAGTAVIGMIIGIIVSVVESIGDYFVAARLAQAPPPPSFAINRGILMEGIGCAISGLFGCGAGTTSYSENVGAIAITRVGSRRVIQFSAGFMLVFGLIPKIGSLFLTVPDPVYGGVFLAMFAMVTGVGLSNLQNVDLSKTRNSFIVGFALFTGMMVPSWVKAYPGRIQLGAGWINNSAETLLSMGMFVGAIVAFTLDNTIAGTDEERGLTAFRAINKNESTDDKINRKTVLQDNYELPILQRMVRKFPDIGLCPLFPRYRASNAVLNEVIGLK